MRFRPQLNFDRTPLTLIFMATIVALELIFQFGGDRRMLYIVRWVGLTPAVWDWELWRPFTATLIHGGLLHAAFNVYWLALFGAVLEGWWGSGKFAAFVVFIAVATGMVQFVLPDIGQPWNDIGKLGGVGFSGVMYGMFGFLLVARHRHHDLYAICDNNTAQILLAWAVICVPLTFLGVLPVANLAHFSGLGLGFAIGKSLFELKPQQKALWRVGLVLAAILAISPIVYAPWVQNYRAMKADPDSYQKAWSKYYND